MKIFYVFGHFVNTIGINNPKENIANELFHYRTQLWIQIKSFPSYATENNGEEKKQAERNRLQARVLLFASSLRNNK